jgi:holo-[acyl-carrier protein] synthase
LSQRSFWFSRFPVFCGFPARQADGLVLCRAFVIPFLRRMSLIGLGIDMIEVPRIEHSLQRFGTRFMQRVFTESEIAYCQSMKFPARHFAARFAAKEALSKAFGTGIGKAMGWREIDIRKKESGEPFVILNGGAEWLAGERGVNSVLISLSHTDHHAVAVIALQSDS